MLIAAPAVTWICSGNEIGRQSMRLLSFLPVSHAM
jgi:hypothetical protein